MVRKQHFRQGPPGDNIRVFLVAPEPGKQLRTQPADRFIIEARFVQGLAQHIKRLIAVFRQGLHIARKSVAPGAETQRDRQVLQSSLEGLRIEIAAALVNQRRGHLGQTFLADGIK